MTFDDAIDDIAATDGFPVAALQWLLDEWDTTGPQCRALLVGYVSGRDHAERTEQALFFVVHLLGEQCDTASFVPLCTLLGDRERADLVFGDDALTLTMPSILISTFDGERQHLCDLVENAGAPEMLRAEVLMVLAYLARTRRVAEAEIYDYLAALPDRLPQVEHFVWYGWVRAIAALGFAGLSGRVEAAFRDELVPIEIMEVDEFWKDLRESQQEPNGTSSPAWDGLGPMASTIDELRSWQSNSPDPMDDSEELWGGVAEEPIRNPFRNVGRNDPCPCGSGKKFKKCCLGVA